MKKGMVEYYGERIEFYRKQRGGKGITQGDMEKARKDVKEYLKLKEG